MSSDSPPTPPHHSDTEWWDWRNLATLNWGRSWQDILQNLIPEHDTQPKAPMTTNQLIIGSANFNFGFGRDAQLAQANRMKAKCDILGCQELEHSLLGNAWTGMRPGNESIWWKRAHTPHVIRAHVRPAVTGAHPGLKARNFIRIDYKAPWGTFRYINGHMPPARFHNTLYPRYVDTLHNMIDRSPHPVIVGADWNERLTHDPAGLHSIYGMEWHGTRIDGFASDRRLHDHIGGYHEEITDARRKQDNHPDCYLTIKM